MGNLKVYQPTSLGPQISHIMFANDLILVAKFSFVLNLVNELIMFTNHI